MLNFFKRTPTSRQEQDLAVENLNHQFNGMYVNSVINVAIENPKCDNCESGEICRKKHLVCLDNLFEARKRLF